VVEGDGARETRLAAGGAAFRFSPRNPITTTLEPLSRLSPFSSSRVSSAVKGPDLVPLPHSCRRQLGLGWPLLASPPQSPANGPRSEVALLVCSDLRRRCLRELLQCRYSTQRREPWKHKSRARGGARPLHARVAMIAKSGARSPFRASPAQIVLRMAPSARSMVSNMLRRCPCLPRAIIHWATRHRVPLDTTAAQIKRFNLYQNQSTL